jgi:hypothetical protein
MTNRMKVLIIAIVFPILVHIYMYATFSRLGACERIRIGETRSEVIRSLTPEGIVCYEHSQMPSSTVPHGACVFRDPWRQYEVMFDKTGTVVVSKSVTLRIRSFSAANPLALRIPTWAYGLFSHPA